MKSVDFNNILNRAIHGENTAKYELGVIYEKGICGEQNYEKALYWYVQASGADIPFARNGVESVSSSIIASLEPIVTPQSSADVQFKLGEAYFYYDWEKDRALYWWNLAAEQGYAKAKNSIGVTYYNKGDYAKALYWWNLAAEQEEVGALYNIGYAFYNGKGCEKDFTKALHMWKKAAKLGHVLAQSKLGKIYYEGKECPRNEEKGLYWLNKAAAQGDTDANDMINFIRNKKLSEEGEATAQYKLGEAYYRGKGCSKDREKALYWWERAAEQGHKEAIECAKALGSKCNF